MNQEREDACFNCFNQDVFFLCEWCACPLCGGKKNYIGLGACEEGCNILDEASSLYENGVNNNEISENECQRLMTFAKKTSAMFKLRYERSEEVIKSYETFLKYFNDTMKDVACELYKIQMRGGGEHFLQVVASMVQEVVNNMDYACLTPGMRERLDVQDYIEVYRQGVENLGWIELV